MAIPTTNRIGEEGPYPTIPIGEDYATTDAIGEEGTTTIEGEEDAASSVSTVDNPFGSF